MSVCPSDRNDVVVIAARGVHQKHHHVTPQPQRLQAQFTLRCAPIFAGHGVPFEHDADTDEVEPMNFQVAKALGFVIGEHNYIVDSNKYETKHLGELFAGGLSFGLSPIGFEPVNNLKLAKAPRLPMPQALWLRPHEVIQ